MMQFWFVAGGMLALALAVLLVPLLRKRNVTTVPDGQKENVRIARERLAELKDELRSGVLDNEGFERARADLEATLATDLAVAESGGQGARGGTWLAVLVVLAVPALAVMLYLSLGDPAALQGQNAAGLPADHPDMAQQQDLPSVDEMIARLQARLQENPDDPQGWYMLGRSYLALGRYQEAADALQRTQELVGDQPDVLVAHADALAMVQGGSLQGKPMELVQRALASDPQSATALWLAGMGYQQAGDLDKAIAHWQRARDQMPPQSEARTEIQSLIDRAKAAGGQVAQGPVQGQAQSGAAANASAPGQTVSVTVDLAPEVKRKLDPDATVFVFATPPDGSRMPVAAVKRRVADLPLHLRLSDDDAMAPVARISNYQQVKVGARVSLSGNPMPASGDWTAETRTVDVGSDQVTQLTIDHRIP